ncbi:hypothetical protein GCM10023322_44290 [Rugosimonospora acidiphila]|uniref:Phosphotransferase enzyme family protein n=1 Tax=Rugosimonospora acidiphila TaxID=556531 RepID=A0ABP9S3H7_9ACTN
MVAVARGLGWWRRQPPIRPELAARLGSPRPIRGLASSPRSRVWLVEFDGDPAIVKQIVGGPDAGHRFAREAAALRLAARARPAVVPALLATVPTDRVLVLEYLAAATPPDDWLLGYAETLARLHATTTVADAGTLPAWRGPDDADVRAFLSLAERLPVRIPPGAPAELRDLVRRLDPAGHGALLHGDPCPDNDLHTARGMRFVDLEQASLGNGLTELAYLRIGFPTCWCATATPPPLREEAESAYRRTWRSLTGSDPAGEPVDACAGWLIRGDALVERARREAVDHLARVDRKDWRWGTATARQRLLHRLDTVAAMARDHTRLSGVARLTAAMADQLRLRWPTLRPLPERRPIRG